MATKKKTKKSVIKKKAVRKPVAKKISPKKTGKPAIKQAAAKKAVKPARKPAKAVKKSAAPKGKKQAAQRSTIKAGKPFAQESRYEPAKVEKKWQVKWEADKLYRAVMDENKPKHYALTMLPYPSGDLHIGHWYAMTPSDARARFKRMNGFNVMFPMEFDAFGLPAENAAISRGIHPKEWTFKNIDNMRKQLKSMGAMFDWERQAVSADTKYYKWTEWFFIQLFKNGLAYRKMSAVDWCPKDNTTLAREQVVGEDRVCERCGTPVIKKNLDQWFFRITKYADELLNFTGIDWPDNIQTLQKNWIGRSEGAEVQFPVISGQLSVASDQLSGTSNQSSVSGDQLDTEHRSLVTVFTTRPDTLWGATFMVFSPEHPLVDKITTDEHRAEVAAYKTAASRMTDIDREATDKEKTGVFTGGYAINPVNDERIPIWIADYVLITYGTGAIMAVPAHDERDFEFARKFGLKIIPVIQAEGADTNGDTLEAAYEHEGVMINSGPFNGTKATKDKGLKNPAIKAVIEWLEQKGVGKRAVNYRIRDWLISRQRYWGAPIPMIHCEKHGWNPVPEDQLPVLLPDDVAWKPTGESPLKLHPTWKNTTCPVCGEPATRETDTMDTFMCSSWYHLRYLSPDFSKGAFDDHEYNYWMPVDTYTGGAEHAVMHLLYTRFFHKALRDAGIVEGAEPVMQLRNQGQILGPDGQRMSKSRGNVIDPDEQVRAYGADTVRAFLMFGYRWSEGGPWTTGGIDGTSRWLRRVWAMFTDVGRGGGGKGGSAVIAGSSADIQKSGRGTGGSAEIAGSSADIQKTRPNNDATRELRRRVHQTLRNVTRDFEQFEFNTIVSSLMELLNEMQKAREAGAAGTKEWNEAVEIYLKMMAPVTPHIAEEIWSQLGKPYSIHTQAWPKVDEAASKEDVIEIPVQVNGKVRDRITIAADATEEQIKSAALASEGVKKYLEGKEPKKVIVVQRRLVSVVV